MKLGVVIPARNEEGNLEHTVPELVATLERQHIPYEIVIVDDGSTDATVDIVRRLAEDNPAVRLVQNHGRHGFGMAVRIGLEATTADAIVIMMADASDSPEDLVLYYQKLQQGYECVFGSRFIAGGRTIDYPRHKLFVNRMANTFIRILFGFRYNDVTNAFKCYRREVIDAMQPLISPHFNLTVEMPLKAIVRGYSYAVVPIGWRNRAVGLSKLKIKEMGSRYLFIVLYLWLERLLSRGDYHRKSAEPLVSEAKQTIPRNA